MQNNANVNVNPNTVPFLHVDVYYRVTQASDDGTFQPNDRIRLLADGCIENQNAAGWIEPEDVAEATRGMTVRPDVDVRPPASSTRRPPFKAHSAERRQAPGAAARQARKSR